MVSLGDVAFGFSLGHVTFHLSFDVAFRFSLGDVAFWFLFGDVA